MRLVSSRFATLEPLFERLKIEVFIEILTWIILQSDIAAMFSFFRAWNFFYRYESLPVDMATSAKRFSLHTKNSLLFGRNLPLIISKDLHGVRLQDTDYSGVRRYLFLAFDHDLFTLGQSSIADSGRPHRHWC